MNLNPEIIKIKDKRINTIINTSNIIFLIDGDKIKIFYIYLSNLKNILSTLFPKYM